jgi:hypothetical protein
MQRFTSFRIDSSCDFLTLPVVMGVHLGKGASISGHDFICDFRDAGFKLVESLLAGFKTGLSRDIGSNLVGKRLKRLLAYGK